MSIFRHVIEGIQPSMAAVQVSNDIEQASFGITIPSPLVGDDFSLGFTNKTLTIQEIRSVLRGSGSPSIAWTIRFDNAPDRSAAGIEVVSSGTVTTSITSGDDITSFDNAVIPADSFIWMEITDKSGSVDEFHLTLISVRSEIVEGLYGQEGYGEGAY